MIAGIPIPYAFVIFGMLLLWGMATADKSLMAIALICAMLTGYKASISTDDDAMGQRRDMLAGCIVFLAMVGAVRALIPLLW